MRREASGPQLAACLTPNVDNCKSVLPSQAGICECLLSAEHSETTNCLQLAPLRPFTTGPLRGSPIQRVAIAVTSRASLSCFQFKVLLLAILSAVVICVLVNLLFGPVVERLAGNFPSNTRFENVRGKLPVLMGWLSVAWTLAAFGEEMVFRGYFMTRISDLIGNGRTGWISAFLLSSLLCGLGHGYQGLAGAIGTTEIGLLIGALYLVNR